MTNKTKDRDISVKQRLFVLWNTAKRTSEARAYLVEECILGKRFYEKQIAEIDKCLQPECLGSYRQDRGAAAAWLNKRREFSHYLSQYVSLLSTITTNVLDLYGDNCADSDTDDYDSEEDDEEEDEEEETEQSS